MNELTVPSLGYASVDFGRFLRRVEVSSFNSSTFDYNLSEPFLVVV